MILFRADGNKKIGLGHLYRIFSIIEKISELYKYKLLIKKETLTDIIPNHIDYHIIENEFHQIENYKELGYKLLIADGYQFDSIYQKKIKDLDLKLIYIDDLTSEKMYADIIINHSAGLKKTDFNLSKYSKLYLGPKYALLRNPFYSPISKSKKLKNSLFISFGGSDPFNILEKFLPIFFKNNIFDYVNVVIGKAYKKTCWLKKYREKNNFFIYENISALEMKNVIDSSSIAIVPSSTILYEVCSRNVPVISGYYVQNQKKIYNGFLNSRLIYGIGDMKNCSHNEILLAVNNLLGNAKTMKLLKNNQKLFFDNKSMDRILKLINSLV